MQIADMLEEMGIDLVPAEVYNDENLSLVDSWNVCCVPTVVFYPSFHKYESHQITREIVQKELNDLNN